MMSGKRDLLTAEGLTLRFKAGQEPLFEAVSLTVGPGELVGIVGPSGSGKSTLLKALNGTIPKHIDGQLTGEVLLDGREIGSLSQADLARAVGTVFQDPDQQILFSCVEDEIAFGPENLCLEPAAIRERVDSVCALLGITALLYRNPNNLSGGEKQLVVIAAVLSLDVSVLLLDECMSMVDEAGRGLLLQRIAALKEEGKAIIMVDHEMDNLCHADRIYTLDGGQLTPLGGEADD